MLTDYAWYKSHGICVQCMQYDAAPGRVRCEVCLLTNAEGADRQFRREKSCVRSARRRALLICRRSNTL